MIESMCVFLALQPQEEDRVSSIVRNLLKSEGIRLCPHTLKGRDVREVCTIQCNGPCLLICDDRHAPIVESPEVHDFDEFYTIIIGRPKHPQLVNQRRAYATLDTLPFQLKLTLSCMLTVPSDQPDLEI